MAPSFLNKAFDAVRYEAALDIQLRGPGGDNRKEVGSESSLDEMLYLKMIQILLSFQSIYLIFIDFFIAFKARSNH